MDVSTSGTARDFKTKSNSYKPFLSNDKKEGSINLKTMDTGKQEKKCS